MTAPEFSNEDTMDIFSRAKVEARNAYTGQ